MYVIVVFLKVMEGGEHPHSSKKPMSVVFRLSTGKKSRGWKEPRDSLRLPAPSVPASDPPVAFPHPPQPPQAPEDTSPFPDADSRLPKEKPKKARMKELKQKKKSEKSKTSKKIEEATEVLELSLKASAKKKKRKKKISGADVAVTEPSIDKVITRVNMFLLA